MRFLRKSFLVGELVFLVALVSLVTDRAVRSDFNDNLYTAGHSDISLRYIDDKLVMDWRLGNTATVNGSTTGAITRFAPSDLTVVVPENEFTSAIANEFVATDLFHGTVGVGDPFYVLPQIGANQAFHPFPGFRRSELSATDFDLNTMTFMLVGLSGPGEVALWRAAGPTPVNDIAWKTADGISDADAFILTSGHTHYNWGFSRSGVYDLTLRGSVRTLSGELLSTQELEFCKRAFSAVKIGRP